MPFYALKRVGSIRFQNQCRTAYSQDDSYNLSLVNTENLATTGFDPQLAVVFDIRCRSTKGNEKSPNVSQDRVNWTSTMADRILPVGNGGVLGSSKSMSKSQPFWFHTKTQDSVRFDSPVPPFLKVTIKINQCL